MTVNQYFKPPSVYQQILIDTQGFILESSDTIFTVERNRPAMEWSLFLASILPSLSTLQRDSAEIHFPRIDSITNTLTGLYDCSFVFVEWEEGKWVLVWNIFDFSKSKNLMKKRQQKANRAALKSETVFVA